MIPLASLADIGNTLMTPFYWLISSLMIFFHWLLTPIFGTSNGAQGWVWFLAIVLMTCVIRGVMLPLYAKQMNSQRAMTSLQPKIKEIQKKYAADRQRQAAETQKLYQEAGVSPYASCLPMLVQMPVFMSVFWVIRGIAVEGSALRGMFTIYPTTPLTNGGMMSDLKASFMNASIAGAKLSETFMTATTTGTKVFAVILVVAMMATLFYQQWYMLKRNMPPSMLQGPMGQQQKIMLYVFPFIYLFSGAAMPIGILLYWLLSNVWTMAQQYVIVRIYPTPDTPAYADWEDRMYAQGKDPVAIEKARIEKARSKRKGGGGLTAKMVAMAAQQSADAEGDKTEAAKAAQSQVVTRQDPATGKQVVVRKQTKNVSRAKRKH